MRFRVLKSVFACSLLLLLSLSVGIVSLDEPDNSDARLNSYTRPQNSASSVEVVNLSASDCASLETSTELMLATCTSTHPAAGSFHAVVEGDQMRYFSDATFGNTVLSRHAITLDDHGHIHLAYISKVWTPYGSDPLGAGYVVQNVNYAYFNGTSWNDQIVIADATEERSWWTESFGSLQLAVEAGGKVHLTYVHRLDEDRIRYHIRHWTLDNEETSNVTVTTTLWNGNELSPTSLNMNTEGRLYLTYYDTEGLSLMVKNPNSSVWFGSDLDIQSELSKPMWSNERLRFAPHASTLDSNDQLHVCYYDMDNGLLMYTSNSTSLSEVALNDAPLQWSTTTVSTDSSIQTGMLCSLEVDLNGDVHLFYARYADNSSFLMHAVLHDDVWYLSELSDDQGTCGESGLNCYSGSLPLYSDSKVYVLLDNEMLLIGLDEDYENRTDYDNDGALNSNDSHPFDDREQSDYDMDGVGDTADPDDDNDGVDDDMDVFPFNELEHHDSDGDGVGDNADLDDDNDGYPDDDDAFPMDASEHNDTDNDGLGDHADTDDDNDGWSDAVELECMSDQYNASDTPPDLNVNSICDRTENYTQETEAQAASSNSAALVGAAGVSLVVVSGLVVVLVKRGKQEDDDWFEETDEIHDETTSFAASPGARKDTPVDASPDKRDHVNSWEELPEGEWLDNDAEGTHWYRAQDGTHWYSTDDGYRVWDES